MTARAGRCSPAVSRRPGVDGSRRRDARRLALGGRPARAWRRRASRSTASSSRTPALAGRPESVVDGDERTAWSPAADDTSPTLVLTVDDPADVQAVTIDARRGWMARHRPFVEVRLDDREQVVRASADGRLAVSGTDVRTVSVRILPLVGRSRGAPASLEVEEVGLAGDDLPLPPQRLTRPCGGGPVLTVDGATVPTRLDGPRTALWGEGDLQWVACAPVVLGARAPRTPSSSGATRPCARHPSPSSARGRSRARRRRRSTVTSQSPTHLTGTVGAGPQRLLALAMNHNDGWEAELAGRALTPLVVDGFRQGFVLPDGAAGALEVRFAPDGPYRSALGLGLLLVLLRPARAARPGPVAAPVRARPVTRMPSRALPSSPRVTLGGALLVAGPWAVLAAAVALAALHLRRERRDDGHRDGGRRRS